MKPRKRYTNALSKAEPKDRKPEMVSFSGLAYKADKNGEMGWRHSTFRLIDVTLPIKKE